MLDILYLDNQLDKKHLLKHPFYEAWSEGRLSLDDLRTYACQYYHHVEAFPRYLSATHSNCDSLPIRQVLLDNLIDEEQGPSNHPALWLQFANGLGLSESRVKETKLFPETAQLIDDFKSLSRSSYVEGIAALYTYERQVPYTAASKITGLKKHYGIDDAKTLKFFTVHLHADVEHANATRTLLEQLPENEQIVTENAAIKIADSLWTLLTGILHRTCGATC